MEHQRGLVMRKLLSVCLSVCLSVNVNANAVDVNASG